MDHGTGRGARFGAVAGPAVASTEPARIRAKAVMMPVVSGSPRNAAPAATATAGLTYVITVSLVGPAFSTAQPCHAAVPEGIVMGPPRGARLQRLDRAAASVCADPPLHPVT
ncbi:hypothetical protein ACFYZJ_03340 [Streptomyces sp. NPDC001848]|uniref:hypothetical protein n=1 Tax=Streptomyces sp. NPDC001848 TaxID=3364618 RepID=UPI0036AD6619